MLTARGVDVQLGDALGAAGPPLASNRVHPAPVSESSHPLPRGSRDTDELLALHQQHQGGEQGPEFGKKITFAQEDEEALRQAQAAVIGWASAPTVKIADDTLQLTRSPSRRDVARKDARASSGTNATVSPRPLAAPPAQQLSRAASGSLFNLPSGFDHAGLASDPQQLGQRPLWVLARWLSRVFPRSMCGGRLCGGEDWAGDPGRGWLAGGGAAGFTCCGCCDRWNLPLILPHQPGYQYWWFFTMLISLITAALDPYRMAFEESAGLYPYTDVWAWLEYIAITIFSMDITSKFFLAYRSKDEGLVTQHSRIATHYLRFMFWVDVIATFPIDGVAAAALGLKHRGDSDTAVWLGLVRWLRVARLYRIFDLFDMLEHKMIVSQVTLILLRNNVYVIYITHWMACLFYWLAEMEQRMGMTNSWVLRHVDRWEDQGVGAKYLYSLYFSVSAFAGLGDGDFYVATPVESLIMILYLLFNIVLQAYILGTITMVMVKSDEKSQVFRSRMEALRSFSDANALPDSLATAMREHIELQFLRDQATDEQVLSDYPATLRRKALRHLYAHCLVGCSLFRGLRGRFLDQLLVGCRSELYMPHVSLLSEGDVVSELLIIVDGEARGIPMGHHQPDLNKLRRTSNMAPGTLADMTANFNAAATARRRSVASLHPQGSGALLGSGGASTGGGLLHSQTSVELSALQKPLQRLDVIRGHAGGSSQSELGRASKQQGGRRSSMERLQTRGSATSWASHAQGYGPMDGRTLGTIDWDADAITDGSRLYATCDCIGAVSFFTDTSSPESVYTTAVTRVLILTKAVFDTLSTNYPQQIKVLLENLRDATEEEFLEEVDAASAHTQAQQSPGEGSQAGLDTARLRQMLSTGNSFTSSKAGSRSNSGLDPEARLQQLAASLPPAQQQRLLQLGHLRKCVGDFFRKQKAQHVYEFLLAAASGDLATMRGLMQQGVKPGCTDYDRRSALIIAAHEGQDAVVRLLLSCQAPLGARDAFGNTALSEAVLQGHDHVVGLLLAAGAPLGLDPGEGYNAMCRAICEGNMQQLRRLLQAGASANWVGYDGSTALHVAATEGNLQAAELLVEFGSADVTLQDRCRMTAVDEARECGHTSLVEYLEPLLQQQAQQKQLEAEAVAQLQQEQSCPLPTAFTPQGTGASSQDAPPSPFSLPAGRSPGPSQSGDPQANAGGLPLRPSVNPPAAVTSAGSAGPAMRGSRSGSAPGPTAGQASLLKSGTRRRPRRGPSAAVLSPRRALGSYRRNDESGEEDEAAEASAPLLALPNNAHHAPAATAPPAQLPIGPETAALSRGSSTGATIPTGPDVMPTRASAQPLQAHAAVRGARAASGAHNAVGTGEGAPGQDLWAADMLAALDAADMPSPRTIQRLLTAEMESGKGIGHGASPLRASSSEVPSVPPPASQGGMVQGNGNSASPLRVSSSDVPSVPLLVPASAKPVPTEAPDSQGGVGQGEVGPVRVHYSPSGDMPRVFDPVVASGVPAPPDPAKPPPLVRPVVPALNLAGLGRAAAAPAQAPAGPQQQAQGIAGLALQGAVLPNTSAASAGQSEAGRVGLGTGQGPLMRQAVGPPPGQGVEGPRAKSAAPSHLQPQQSSDPAPADGSPVWASLAHAAAGPGGVARAGASQPPKVSELPVPPLSLLGSARSMQRQGSMTAGRAHHHLPGVAGALAEAAAPPGSAPAGQFDHLLASGSFLGRAPPSFDSSLGGRLTAGGAGGDLSARTTDGSQTVRSNLGPSRGAAVLPSLEHVPDVAAAVPLGSPSEPQNWPMAQAKTLQPLGSAAAQPAAAVSTAAAAAAGRASGTTPAVNAAATAGVGAGSSDVTSGDAAASGGVPGSKLLGTVARGSL